jgi:glycosidase
MFDVAKFWLEEMDEDGFRLDAVKYIFEEDDDVENTASTFDFWQDFRSFYKSIEPESFAVGEAWTATSTARKYVENDGLDYCFEFDLSYAIIDAAHGNKSSLEDKLDEVMRAYPFMQFGTFLTNHDQNRVMNELSRSESKARLASQLLLTLPGIPYLYYGEEIGQLGTKPDEDIRRPLQWDNSPNAGFTTGNPWRAPYQDFADKNIAAQQEDPGSLWSNYRDFIKLRTDQKALAVGDYTLIDHQSSTLMSFLRTYQDEKILVVTNLSSNERPEVMISQVETNLPAGEYSLVNLVSPYNVKNVTVDASGEVTDLSLDAIPARSTHLYKFSTLLSTVESRNFVNIYPNPADSRVRFSLAGSTTISECHLYDLLGNAIEVDLIDQQELVVDRLPEGIYFLKATLNNSEVITQKLIIKH